MRLFDLPTDVDSRGLETAIMRYVTELGLELPRVVKQTFRLLMQDVGKLTAPKNNTQGRKAVKRDIGRAIYMLDPDKVTSAHLRSLIQSRNYAAIEIAFKGMKTGNWNKIKRVVPFDSSFHKSRRDSRGRVTSLKGVATPDVSAHKKYVRSMQGHVGYARSGWNPASVAAGLTLPNWVSRHTNPPGSVVDRSSDKESPFMSATHAGKTTRSIPITLVQRAAERRIASMKRDVSGVLHGRASRYFS